MGSNTQPDSPSPEEQGMASADPPADAEPEPAGRWTDALPLLLVVALLLLAPVLYDLVRWLRAR